MMERQQVLDRFAEYVKKHLVPLADPEQYPVEKLDRAVHYQGLVEEARWAYRRLRAGGDAITILERFRSSKVQTGAESKALQLLIKEVKRG